VTAGASKEIGKVMRVTGKERGAEKKERKT
jgi:hypothetical protein